MSESNPHIGSSFESFLDEEGILEDCTAVTIKRVLARQIERAMRERGLTKSAMAKTMRSGLTGGRIGRVIFCVSEGHAVLLHGFVKKSQKTPSADLELARRRMKKVTS